jgi:hypothetical protein
MNIKAKEVCNITYSAAGKECTLLESEYIFLLLFNLRSNVDILLSRQLNFSLEHCSHASLIAN